MTLPHIRPLKLCELGMCVGEEGGGSSTSKGEVENLGFYLFQAVTRYPTLPTTWCQRRPFGNWSLPSDNETFFLLVSVKTTGRAWVSTWQ